MRGIRFIPRIFKLCKKKGDSKMKKKILSMVLALSMLCAFMPVIVNAATSGTCGKNGANVTWTLDDEGTLTISGEGEMGDYVYVQICRKV